MSRAVLSVGSNIGDASAHLRAVAVALGGRLVAASPIYRTAPWGGVEQADFLNAVLVAEDAQWDMWRWLEFAHECEEAALRVREVRWGPRTLDVDVVACYGDTGELRSADPRLLLPHPRAGERAFVLLPWLDADPAAVLDGRPLAEVIAGLPPGERAGARNTGTQVVG